MNCSENNNKQLMAGKERKDKEQRIVRHAQTEAQAHICRRLWHGNDTKILNSVLDQPPHLTVIT